MNHLPGEQDRTVWLRGPNHGDAILFDPSTGRVVRRLDKIPVGAEFVGQGQPCSGRFVALYRSSHEDSVVLSIGSFLMPLDSPSVRVRYRCVGGVVSVLRVSNGPARRDRRAAVRVSWAWFWHLIDPAFDEDDAEAVDILRLIGGVCAKPGRGA